jgi:hypothetical protein
MSHIRPSRRRVRRIANLDAQLAGAKHVGFYDPEGVYYGIPTYPWRSAPKGLATLRQLRAQGLRPGGQDIAAQIMWRQGTRIAYLYDIKRAKPKREATPAQLVAINLALIARRTCNSCGQYKPYYIPRRYGECLDCAGIYTGVAA